MKGYKKAAHATGHLPEFKAFHKKCDLSAEMEGCGEVLLWQEERQAVWRVGPTCWRAYP